MREPTVGLPHSPARVVAAAELAAAVVRRAAGRLRTRVAAVGRPGDDGTVVVAYPFRHRRTAELFGDAVADVFAAITRHDEDPTRALDRIRQRWPTTIRARRSRRCARRSRSSR